jgi:hypothetical protein
MGAERPLELTTQGTIATLEALIEAFRQGVAVAEEITLRRGLKVQFDADGLYRMVHYNGKREMTLRWHEEDGASEAGGLLADEPAEAARG